MEQQILEELKKINSQLSQLLRLAQENRPTRGFGAESSPQSQSIGDEVKRRIQEAKQKAREKVSSAPVPGIL